MYLHRPPPPEEGRPVRDEDSTTYAGAIESAEDFGLRIYAEAWRRGWSRAKKKVVIADGAIWIWNLADQHFPGAVQIVDLYHARQHLWELSAKLFPTDERLRKRWTSRCLKRLEKGKTETLVKTLREVRPIRPELAKLVSNEADYFERNAERMRYPAFRAQGLFVGSGVVEAGCKEVVGSRLKRSGMFWTVRGANAIIALRCCRLSGRFEDYWESRSRAADPPHLCRAPRILLVDGEPEALARTFKRVSQNRIDDLGSARTGRRPALNDTECGACGLVRGR